ncbi:hypothetical protein TWF569_002622 [Orbilia oligospora]|uniref:peptidylprolyl isomerase n=1 Tax=Orbilia oligospora TaxID=2813651 RepID=A0A7C8JD85_ORBOL|nr:hypothetical protein TWF706_003751 [Orbilia oligospora]KAF3106488.1 hypothetical protein TWF102_001438 [Orbilia oligospora]KAF3106603.1 hypothetical protein TWF103_006095 [Orbilia oligospora]KAF3130737.1 hypothetical protein TWF594_010260 [Orbilia oligospora]KAF3152796.1 hypothetical protein TWF569_002622 [Orbilia oligospora]
MAAPIRPRCFLDLQYGTDPVGRVVIELFTDKTPKTCENFRSLCTASTSPSLHYKSSIFHRVIEEFMLQGGDITRGDGKGGVSIYGDTFEDENLGWCDIDKEGLVCMANRGKDTNSSQFFITCAPCDHLNGKHTVFGHVVSGLQFVKEMEKVRVDSSDKPVVDVIISNCGELEFRRALAKAAATRTMDTKTSRDRKRQRSQSRSRSRSRTRSRSKSESRSGSRTRDRRRSRTRSPRAKPDRHKRQERDTDSRRPGRRHRDRAGRSRSPRRHGNASTKESAVLLSQNQDVRSTSRSQSPEKPISPTGQRDSRSSRNHHKPSRRSYSRSRSRSYDRHGRGRDYDDDEFDSEEERRIQREEDERESNRRQPQYQRSYRSPPRRDDRYSADTGQSEVKFKGRGSMKYREKGGHGGYNRFGRLI